MKKNLSKVSGILLELVYISGEYIYVLYANDGCRQLDCRKERYI